MICSILNTLYMYHVIFTYPYSKLKKKCKREKYGNKKPRVEQVHKLIQNLIVYISQAVNNCSLKATKNGYCQPFIDR